MNGMENMNLREIMQYQTFAVVGNTTDPRKYACIIKEGLIEKGYTAFGVWKEMESIDAIEEEIEVLVLCINPKYGIEYLKECTKEMKAVVIQPGAESQEIFDYLYEEGISYLEGCILVGLKLYPRD
jgi:predicted CoA-binding protein